MLKTGTSTTRANQAFFNSLLAHDQLTFQKSASTVQMHYLRALCANINPQIAIEVDADAAGIPLDRAVPIGLIVNELVTNSVKYAFDDEGGIINVVFRINTAIGEGEVSVCDNGRGMGPKRKGYQRRYSHEREQEEAFAHRKSTV